MSPDSRRTARRAVDAHEVSPFWEGGVSPARRLPPANAMRPLPPPAEASVDEFEARVESAPTAAPEPPRPSFAELEREAFTKGYSQGERAGAEAAARRGEAMLRRLADTVQELAGLRTELIHQTERQVVQLSLAIASRVLRREVSLDRELLVAMARVALERLGENTSATIRLNPADFALIGPAIASPEHGIVRVVADALVSPGGCLVQSDFGLIDVGIDAQLNELAAALGVRPDGDHMPTLEQGAA